MKKLYEFSATAIVDYFPYNQPMTTIKALLLIELPLDEDDPARRDEIAASIVEEATNWEFELDMCPEVVPEGEELEI